MESSSSKKEELSPSPSPNKRDGMRWRHWGVASVSLGICCLNAACFLWACSIPYSMWHSATALPWKESLCLCLIPLFLAYGCRMGTTVMFGVWFRKARKDNLKPLCDMIHPSCLYEAGKIDWNACYDMTDPDIYDRQYFGTEIYAEAAWEFLVWILPYYAYGYVLACFDQLSCKLFQRLPLFVAPVMMYYMAIFAFLFWRSFRMSLNVALRLGEEKHKIA